MLGIMFKLGITLFLFGLLFFLIWYMPIDELGEVEETESFFWRFRNKCEYISKVLFSIGGLILFFAFLVLVWQS